MVTIGKNVWLWLKNYNYNLLLLSHLKIHPILNFHLMSILGKAMIYILMLIEGMVKPLLLLVNNPILFFNNTKHNKNIINLYGLFIIGVIFCILDIARSDTFGLIIMDDVFLCCCLPVVLPIIYFMRNPKHLISVLRDHNLM